MTLGCPGRTADCAGVSRRKGVNKTCTCIVQVFVFWVWISYSSWLKHAFAGQDLSGEGGKRNQRAFTQVGFASQLPCPSPCRGSFFVFDCCCFFFVFDCLCCLFACCVWSSVNICADSQPQYNHLSNLTMIVLYLSKRWWCIETRQKTGLSSFAMFVLFVSSVIAAFQLQLRME